MTEAQLKRRVQAWQKRLGLLHWEIDVCFTDDDPHGKRSSAAAVRVDPFYDSADIEFSRQECAEMDEPAIERTIVHELLHVHFRNVEECVYSIDHLVSADAFSVWQRAFDHAAEGMIERLARSFVPLSE